jgi:hypothetical protein
MAMLRSINSKTKTDYTDRTFSRLKIALEDFNYLLGLPELPHFGADLQSTIYWWAGVAFRNDNKMDKAKGLLQKSITGAPN